VHRFVAGRAQHPAADVVLCVVPQHPVDEAGLSIEVVSGLAQRLDALLKDLRETLSVVMNFKLPRLTTLRALKTSRLQLRIRPLSINTRPTQRGKR